MLNANKLQDGLMSASDVNSNDVQTTILVLDPNNVITYYCMDLSRQYLPPRGTDPLIADMSAKYGRGITNRHSVTSVLEVQCHQVQST